MELSIREAKARFAEAAAAAAAAARGERVVVTKHGRPFVELVSAQKALGMDFEKAKTIRRELGLDRLKVLLPPNFDDPAFSRQVLGLEALRLLLDTHIAIWAALDPGALTEAERGRMAAAGAPLVLSAVAVWELRLKWHSFHIFGSRKGPVAPTVVVAFAVAMDWELLPLTARHAAAELAQPLGHKDPFDELLLVQAQEEGMRLLTRDARLIGHPFAIADGQD